MKGVIALAIKELVTERYGVLQWKEVLERAGLRKEPLLMPISNLDDALVFKIVEAVCSTLSLSMEQLGDVFGDFWVNSYAPNLYKGYFARSRSAKDFLLNMDDLHQAMTHSLPGARPPRFEYEDLGPDSLQIKYISHRPMFSFMVGLIKGVGRYYGTKVEIAVVAENTVRVDFQS
ncbi:MAG: heme NO-binding domain-containing protein [Myxococcota bacterium]|jgi:hypothetical protein|nr:heme NO-binding domain-containing protein [Myxococcota bacterium]